DFICEDDTAVDYLMLDITSCCGCAPDKTVECGSIWSFDRPTAVDGCCGTNVTITLINVVTNVNADGTISSPCSQVITATWQATDCCGNANTCSQGIEVLNPGPDITCATNKTVECGSDWTFDEPIASDPCCVERVIVTVLDTVTNSAGSSPCSQQITRTWQATD